MAKKLEIREIFEEQLNQQKAQQEEQKKPSPKEPPRKTRPREEASPKEQPRKTRPREGASPKEQPRKTRPRKEKPRKEEQSLFAGIEARREAEKATEREAEKFAFFEKLQGKCARVGESIFAFVSQKTAGSSSEEADSSKGNRRNFRFESLITFKSFAEHHKKQLLVIFSIFTITFLGMMGIFNYYMAFEYTYNGKLLGVVKNKEDVLKITDLVEGALTEDRDMQVVIDREKDISFKRVATIGGGVHIDTSEEVLKRLTYVGDINVKAYSITVNGKSTAIVESKETARKVLEDLKNDYTDKGENTVVETSQFVEDVKIKPVNADLQKLQKAETAKETLKSGAIIEKKHTVKPKETLADLAEKYNTTEAQIQQLNEGIDPKKLEVGSQIQVQEAAPLVTLKTTEFITYTEDIEYDVVKKKTKKLYKGEKEVEKKGKKGKKVITAKVEKVNGREVKNEPEIVKTESEPSAEVLLVGDTKRPPSVGDGRFIYPVKNFRFTSKFGWRWGRHHDGIDLACKSNSKVVAGDGGIVIFAGYKGSLGNLVTIDHQNGLISMYGHNNRVTVKAGDKVYEGQQIALSGNTGRSTGAHVHFQIEKGGVPVNPVLYLKKK